MSTLTKPILFGSIGSLCLATILSFPAAAQTQNSRPAQAGSINYVEGQASLAGQTLSSSSVGAAQMEKGQTLSTQTGRVEVLLTPGVFLRVDDNSTVKMVSPNLADTEVAVDQGRAMVEATDVSKLNDIRVDEDGASARILKNGLYDFDAAHNQVRTFKGKLDVYANDQKVGLGEDRQLTLNAGEKLKAHDFNSAQYSDDFYRWSGLRSGYLAEAGTDEASLYVNGGPGWYGPGWYWDPWFDAYTFVPGDGIFYSPFGWGFYSPFAVYGSPFFYNGFYGRAHRFNDFHEPYGHGFEPRGGFRGGGFRGGFHGGGGFRGGGGFHGGGGRGHR